MTALARNQIMKICYRKQKYIHKSPGHLDTSIHQWNLAHTRGLHYLPDGSVCVTERYVAIRWLKLLLLWNATSLWSASGFSLLQKGAGMAALCPLYCYACPPPLPQLTLSVQVKAKARGYRPGRKLKERSDPCVVNKTALLLSLSCSTLDSYWYILFTLWADLVP